MNAQALKVLEEALELSVEDRALLAAELEASVEDAAWSEELEHRIDEVVEGRVQARDVDEVLDELRARYPRR